jgi:ADP-ribosylglycohydrolase
MKPPIDILERAKGCLLGGAIGDALGAPVEFLTMPAIKSQYGPEGIHDLVASEWAKGAWTDDTQMTLFTAEGLIQAKGGIGNPEVSVAHAYQRWLFTQGLPCNPKSLQEPFRGSLVLQEKMKARRAPGNTCLTALSQWQGRAATNDSKGCGTVMRSAPFGFVANSWELAWNCAAITHGHVEAKVSAALLAETIRLIAAGASLREALAEATTKADPITDSVKLLDRAIELSQTKVDPGLAIAELGEGWVAEEALAIAAYCALAAQGDFAKAVLLAVNHNGDSDSTGAICGNLMGATGGLSSIPTRWQREIELPEMIEEIAAHLVAKDGD